MTASARDEAPCPPPGLWRASATTPRLGATQGPRGPGQALRLRQRRGSGWADLHLVSAGKQNSSVQKHFTKGAWLPRSRASLPFCRRPGHFIPANSLNAAPHIQRTAEMLPPTPNPPVSICAQPPSAPRQWSCPGSGVGGARAFVGTIVPCAHSGGRAGSASRGLTSEVARFRPEQNPDGMGWGRGGPVPSGVGALARPTGSPEAQGAAMAPFRSAFRPAARGLGPHTGGCMRGSPPENPALGRPGARQHKASGPT